MSSLVKWSLIIVGSIVSLAVGVLAYGYFKKQKEAKDAKPKQQPNPAAS